MKNYIRPEMPSENQRIKKVISFYCRDNVLLFSKEIGISQPRLNRLFNIDKRNGIYPSPSYDIAQAILSKYKSIDADWLLTGEGQMFRPYQPVDDLHIPPLSEKSPDYYFTNSQPTTESMGDYSTHADKGVMMKMFDMTVQLQAALLKKDEIIEELNATIQALLKKQS